MSIFFSIILINYNINYHWLVGVYSIQDYLLFSAGLNWVQLQIVMRREHQQVRIFGSTFISYAGRHTKFPYLMDRAG